MNATGYPLAFRLSADLVERLRRQADAEGVDFDEWASRKVVEALPELLAELLQGDDDLEVLPMTSATHRPAELTEARLWASPWAS